MANVQQNNIIHDHVVEEHKRFDAPPNKVKVTSENSQLPRPISPPAQIEELNNSYIASPPLPSLIKKMENESVENPFRPTETLYHEVDPIVEAYRQRPFPPSPSGSPIPPQSPTIQKNIIIINDQQHQQSPLALNYTHNELEYDCPQNGKTTIIENYNSSSSNNGTPLKSSTRNASLAEARSPNAPLNTPLLANNNNKDNPNDGTLPRKAELVHIDRKKKRCGCCSVQ